MRTLILLGILLSFGPRLLAEKYECRVVSGVYKSPGEPALINAFDFDKSLKEKTFFVDRKSGRITGSAIFDNSDAEIQVLSDVNDIIDVFVLSSRSKKSDVTILSIRKFEGKITFTYYVEFFGLLLSGECKKV